MSAKTVFDSTIRKAAPGRISGAAFSLRETHRPMAIATVTASQALGA
jgi:hypothetical protein